MRKLKIGIVGAGNIAETAHIPALLMCLDAELTCVVETSIERIEKIKKTNVNLSVYDSINKIKDELDGVIICTPNDTHREIAFECIDRGINVLIEKPIATSYNDALEIQNKAILSNKIAMIGYSTRFWPSVQFVKEIIKNKTLGNVKSFLFQYGSSGGWAPVSNYVFDRKRSGGGAFLINGSHYLDRMIWYFGEPRIYGLVDDSDGGLEANALARFEYVKEGQGFNGIIRISKTLNLTAGCHIEFEHGNLIHQDGKEPTISIGFKGSCANVPFINSYKNFQIKHRPNMYLEQIQEFVYKIRQKEINSISNIEDAVLCTKITEELYRDRKQMNCNWYNKY